MDNRIINIDNAELVIQQNEIIINENAAVPRNEPANIEEDNQLPRNPDGSLDGGIVVPVDSKKTNANECDLTLYLECVDNIPFLDGHPVLSLGVSVCIGLEKSSKLGSVFERYVDFANEHALNNNTKIRPEDLEFVHCAILCSSDTAEASALMKRDRIRVRRSTKDERALEAEGAMIQRELDVIYFEHMRLLLTECIGSDMILECQGNLSDESAIEGKRCNNKLRGHSAILSKRSKWLDGLIQQAKAGLNKRSSISTTDISSLRDQTLSGESDDGEYGIESLSCLSSMEKDIQSEGATKIENDEEDDHVSFTSKIRSESPELLRANDSEIIWVTIPNHSPDAVKLLLEYCYTNSIMSLGQEAFEAAWKPCIKEGEYLSLNDPRRWKESAKHPRVSFAVTLAGIALAEEAKFPRMSLMCEVAACSLLSTSNIVQALSMCTKQEQLTGNPLRRLRKAAMALVLNRFELDQLTRTQEFNKAMMEPELSAILIPSLLVGTMEAVVEQEQKSSLIAQVELMSRMTQEYIQKLDKEDIFRRDFERRHCDQDYNPSFNQTLRDEEIDLINDSFVEWDVHSHVHRKSAKRGVNSIRGKHNLHVRKVKRGSYSEKSIPK